jgi:hypothetical protein
MASDPYADLLNTTGMAGMFNPNPYLEFQGKIPEAGYSDWPTDASGNPIQQPPGMTLNNTPAAPPPAAATGTPQQWGYNNSMLNAMGRNLPSGQGSGGFGYQGGGGGLRLGDIVDLRAQNNAAYGMKQPFGGPVLQSNAQPSPAAAAPAAAANPSGLSRDQYLQLLANPGPVPMGGAQQVPGATPTGSPPPNVLQQFLANRGPQTGAGGYNTSGFFSTLKQLQGGAGGAP